METDGWRTPAPAGFPLTAGMSDGCRVCDPAAAAPNADPILATEEAAPKSDTLDLALFSGFGTLNLTCTASRASIPEAAEGHARTRMRARAHALFCSAGNKWMRRKSSSLIVNGMYLNGTASGNAGGAAG